MDKATLDKLKYLINKKKSVEEICAILEVEVYELYEMVLYLKGNGESYDIIDSRPQKVTSKMADNFSIDTNVRKLCLVSDIHYGSLFDRPDIIRHIYNECDRREIDTIFCCGDLTNGNYSARPSFVSQARIYESEDMIDYVANTHPFSKYIRFYTIAGNHDTSYLYTEDVDIIDEISKVRSDIIYLGRDLVDIRLGNMKMRMYHGCGKKRKSLEDRVTRFYDKIDEEDKPDILQIGHIHHSLYMPIGNTHIFQTAALIDQIPIAENIGLPCERSCWYVQIEYDEHGVPYKVVPEIEMFGQARIRK